MQMMMEQRERFGRPPNPFAGGRFGMRNPFDLEGDGLFGERFEAMHRGRMNMGLERDLDRQQNDRNKVLTPAQAIF